LWDVEDFFQQIWCVLSNPSLGEGRAQLIASSVAIIVALFAFFANLWKNNRNFRNENSASFHSKKSEKLDNALKVLDIYVNDKLDNYREISKKTIGENKEAVEILISHYEIVALGISSSYLSEKYIIGSERFRIINSFMSVSTLAKVLRTHYRNRYAFEYFEMLFIRTYFPAYKFLLFIPEIFLKPQFRLTKLIFQLEYYVNAAISSVIDKKKYREKTFPRSHLDAHWPLLKKRFRLVRLHVMSTALILIFFWMVMP